MVREHPRNLFAGSVTDRISPEWAGGPFQLPRVASRCTWEKPDVMEVGERIAYQRRTRSFFYQTRVRGLGRIAEAE